jgi:hypothetical protein
MTIVAAELSGTLQALVDSRLDTIDRMLMGRVPRQERLAIVREVESQIFDLLQERNTEELDREDVLAVLARLDPPEAFLPDEVGEEPVPTRRERPSRIVRPVQSGGSRVAKASGILGVVSLVLVLIVAPLGYIAAVAFGSMAVFFLFSAAPVLLALIGGILAMVMGICSRMTTAWAVVGVVTGGSSLLFSLAALALVLVTGL